MPSPSTENCYRVRAAERTVHAALTHGGSPLFLYHSARVSSRSPSLVGKPWGCFTFGIESRPLTYDGEVSQLPYLLALPLQSPSAKGLEL